ncbi:MAG TPA: CapA family protein [Rhizobiales bacterium]|nr:CapA family protein [Hyphomicrobiales bacterium]
MSNYPLSYRLTWLPYFLRPSLRGDRSGFHVVPRSAPEKPADAVRLVFAGDLSAVANRALPRVDVELQALFRGADLTVINCESPVVSRVYARLGTLVGVRHAMSATFLADALGAAAVEPSRAVLSLANNHALDQGHDGYVASREAIAALGAHAVGLTAHDKPPRIAAGGLTVSFDAFSHWHNAPREEFAARIRTTPHAHDDSGSGTADLHCAVPHWDWEFRHFPRAETRATARRLVGAGARLVVGHHAHVIQPVERLGDSLVAYGLGDFLGTAWARTRWPLRIGTLFVVDIARRNPDRGRIVQHAMVPFARLRDGARERLAPLDALPRELRRKASIRVDAVLGCE